MRAASMLRTDTCGKAIAPLIAICVCSGCGVALEDKSPTLYTRNSANVYDVTITLEKASPTVALGTLSAVTSAGTFTMSPGPGPLEWKAQVPVTPCHRGFHVQFTAPWNWGLSGNTERAPILGSYQKWIDGSVPAYCSPPIGRLFVVDSFDDLPDDSIGDGKCYAGRIGKCTLRAAVMEANAIAGQDRIELASGEYKLTLQGEDDLAAAGDLDITDEVAIEGKGATIDASNANDRVFDISPGNEAARVNVELRNVTIRGGGSTPALQYGGGIRNRGMLQLVDVQIRDNEADEGGGIGNDGGLVDLLNSNVFENRTYEGPGAGIASQVLGSVVQIRGSSFFDNTAGQHGGAIAIRQGVLYVRDSTIHGNRAGVYGGGLWLNGGLQIGVLRNVTITQNIADYDTTLDYVVGGGITYGGNGNLYVANTVIAENKHGTALTDDCNGVLSSYGFNLIGVADNCIGLTGEDLAGTSASPLDPRLGALTYVGATRSRRPLNGSPVIDAGDPNLPNDARTEYCTHADQVKTARPQGKSSGEKSRCDIGAVERI
jgi:CSLREA domain-containing protein